MEHDFEPQYIISPEKQKTIDYLVKEVKKYDRVYLATDPDREGEAISWHLKNCLGLKDDKIRIEFNEISKNAVLKAMENPREINDDLVNPVCNLKIIVNGYAYREVCRVARSRASSRGPPV